jgi:hypothetical protein
MNFGEANLSSPKVDTTARTTSSSPKYYIASRVDYLASYQFPPTQVFPKPILVFPVQTASTIWLSLTGGRTVRGSSLTDTIL